MDSLGRNITLPIYNADGTSFHGLELKKFTFDTIVMALGDKITGELYYTTNTLMVAQTEYVVYEGVKYYLINPPTIVKEGMKSDNGQAKGMTKYSFTFYHPMFMLNNFPFTDVAVTSNEQKYKSQDKTFYWIGNLVDYVAKLNKNLSGTEWVVEIGSNVPVQDKNKLSEVMQFDKQTMADAVKRGYDTWEIPYVIYNISSTDSRYAQGKRFLVRYGLPIQDILVNNEPYVFQMGQGVGLKNDSCTPKNNKIVTRIAGFGSEDNVPFGYPQIIWTGNQSWNYTINNSSSAANSYPIYDGIVAGQRVRLIHHPFTRSHLMPTIYADTVNKKVNPYATGYDPTIEIKDYYDAVNDGTWNYPNQIIQNAPSYEIHEFSDIKPELGNKYLGGASAFDGDAGKDYLTVQEGLDQLMDYVSETNIDVERQVLKAIYDKVNSGTSGSGSQEDVRYTFSYVVASDTNFTNVKLVSTNLNFTMEIHRTNSFPSAPWDDSMDDDGNYKQSYFNIILPSLGFDVYACAAVTQEMKINMRSGACLGCSFPVEVDWEDYKKNFYDRDGNFAPTGSQRDYTKYPDSTSSSITVICKKELETFGTLMPNIYQQPATNDKFVILGISLPTSYITSAQSRLDGEMKQYMLDNNVHYFEYPLKFDEYFLATHTDILSQMKPNILVRFNFAGTTHALYIKQLSVKYGEKPLPQYNITLTDDVEIVLSPIGKVTDEVSSIRVLLGGGGSGGGDVSLDMLSEYFLSKKDDDTAAGMIRLLRGLQVGENFVTGLLGEGGIFRVDEDGTTYLEADKLYIRMRAYFDTVEVKKYLHSGGNRIASKAGINCSRVEWIDENGDVTNVLEDTVKFRCYFRATGDDGHKITNDFVVNDLAFCKETNVDTTSVDQHGYWRCVIAVSSSPTQDGEHWIDLSKSDCQSGSNIPLAQDDIIQLGNKTDTTRQGAIVEFVGGEDAPAYQIYQGINSYSLVGKNYVRFGYDSQSGGAQAYIGNPDKSTYIWYHYVTEEGVTSPRLDIKANVEFTSPDFPNVHNINELVTVIEGQIDKKAETWYQDEDPSDDWYVVDPETHEATDVRSNHVGDIWYDTSENGGKNTYIWRDRGEGHSPRYYWAEQSVPDIVFDELDGKVSIYIGWGDWIVDGVNTLEEKDLFIPSQNVDVTIGGVQYHFYANKVYRCTNASTPAFEEIDYTDDSRFDGYINQILNGTGASGDSATVANALRVIKGALNEGTQIDGGLVLTSFIGLRSNNRVWAGISGQYQASETGTGYKGHGIAAWYGGAMVDKEVSTSATDYAKSLFRFDGSGYVAGGNLKWDSSGNVTIQGYQISVGGSAVATVGNLADYVTLATDQTITGLKTFSTKIQIGDIYLAYDQQNNALKVYKMSNGSEVAANFYATGGVSALGQSSGSGGGGVTLNQPLSAINSAGLSAPTTNGSVLVYNGGWKYSSAAGIFATSINIAGTATAAGFSATGKDNTYVLLAGGGTKLLSEIGGGSGSVNTITINSNATVYSPDANGNINLPIGFSTLTGSMSETQLNAAINNLSIGASTPTGDDYFIAQYAGGGTTTTTYHRRSISKLAEYVRSTITSSTITTALGFTPVSSSALADYLPITGGTLTGDLTVNAALGVTGNTTLDGNLYIANNKAIQCKNSSGTIQNVIGLSSSNKLQIGYGSASSGYDSFLCGNAVYLCYGTSRTKGLTLDSSGKVTIGSIASTFMTEKLNVNGGIRIGDAVLEWDSDNNAIKVRGASGSTAAANFYATGGVSALGNSSSGQQITLNQPLSAINSAGLSAANTSGQVLVYNGSSWKYSTNANILTNGLTSTGNITANKYYVTGKTDDYVILAGGGTKLLSEIGGGSGDYLPLSAGSANALTGELYANKGISIKYDVDTSRAYGLTAYNTGGTETANILFHNTGNSSKGVWIINAHSGVSNVWTDAVGKYSLFIGDNKLTYNTYNIYHAGNINTANAGSATKLETSRTLWGQSFDGSANVSGNMSSVGNVYLNNARYIYCKTTDNSDNLALGVNSENQFIVGFGPAHQGCDSYIDGKNLYLRYSTSRTTGILLNSSGNVGIGTTSPSVKLHVVGKAIFSNSTNPYINLLCGSSNWYVQSMSDGMYIGCTSSKSLYVDANGNISTASGDGRYIQIGAIRLVYDSTNNAIKVVKSDGTTAANFYATGGVSALGNSSSSSSYLTQDAADNRYLKLSGGQTMSGAFNGTSITLASQMKSTYAIASSNMTVGTSSLNTSYTLYVNGTASIANLKLNNSTSSTIGVASGGKYLSIVVGSSGHAVIDYAWIVTSDMRKKDIVSNVGASIEQIANAPIFNYRMKGDLSGSVSLGTSAQYWQTIFPCGVSTMPDTYLAMDYGATALAAAVITARKVQSHEQRIAALEAENERLRNEINELKAA